MQKSQRSFLLLPDSSFSPGKDIELGRLLMQTRDSHKMPDPRRVFPNLRIDVTPSALERIQKLDKWEWNSNDSFESTGGVWADVSLLTGLGAGLDVGRSKEDGLKIVCEGVTQQTFYSTDEDIDKIVKHVTISRLLGGLDHPSIFLITGLMTAEKARFEITRGKAQGIGAHASADLTATGVPLDLGLKGDVQRTTGAILVSEPQEPFILAYQLHRIRKRRIFRGYEDSIERMAALFSDDAPAAEADSFRDFEIEMLIPSPSMATGGEV